VQAVLPCAEYYKRQGFPLKKIVAFASNRDYSDLLVFNEDRKEVRQLFVAMRMGACWWGLHWPAGVCWLWRFCACLCWACDSTDMVVGAKAQEAEKKRSLFFLSCCRSMVCCTCTCLMAPLPTTR
jgi:hypothetical protein